MNDEELRVNIRETAAEYHQVRINLEDVRKRLRPLIVEALRRAPGIRQKDVIADSELTREYIRRIARKEGIGAGD